MRPRFAALFAFLAIQALPTPAHAATGTALFAGTILDTCTIVIGTAGVLDLDITGTSFGTTSGLGVPALAVVTTTGLGFNIDVDTPSGFTIAPSGGNTNVSFSTEYSTTGVTSAGGVLGGVLTALGLGITSLSIDLTATKPDAFPAGLYTAETVITCE